MEIREYREADKQSWIRCRVLSFLESSFYDDVQRSREKYENPVIQIVAINEEEVIGFLDCEYETKPGDLCYFEGTRGGVIWYLGVLPEYRGMRLATRMWETAKGKLQEQGIHRIEVWTQDDNAANNWYIRQGFIFKEAYLNAFVKGDKKDKMMQQFLDLDHIGEVYGIRNLNFEAPIERKEELAKICYRLHEVRAYEWKAHNNA